MNEPPENRGPDQERIVVAGEVALGLTRLSELDPSLRDDPAFTEEVNRWEEELAKLAGELAPAPPPPRVWAALSRAMNAAATAPSSQGGWLQNLALWRSIAAASLAVALVLAFLLVQSLSVRPPAVVSRPGTLLVATLAPKEGPPLFTAAYDPSRRIIVVVPAAFEPEPGRIAEFWITPKDSDEPIALARLEPSQPTTISLSAAEAQRIDEETGLAVTSEPAGASVPRSAAGPLIAHGSFASF